MLFRGRGVWVLKRALFWCLKGCISSGQISNSNRSLTFMKLRDLSIFFFFKVCCVCSFLDYEPLTYSGGYMFPGWAYHLGRAIALSSMLTVLVWAAIKLCLTEGTFRQARARALFTKTLFAIHMNNATNSFCILFDLPPFSCLFCTQRLEALWYPVCDFREKEDHVGRELEMTPMSPSLPNTADPVWNVNKINDMPDKAAILSDSV